MKNPLGDKSVAIAGNLTMMLLLYRSQHRKCSRVLVQTTITPELVKKKSQHLLEPKNTLSCSNHHASCCILSQIEPIHAFACCLFKIYYRTLLPLPPSLLFRLLQPSVSFSLLDPNVFLNTLFSKSLSLCFSLPVRG